MMAFLFTLPIFLLFAVVTLASGAAAFSIRKEPNKWTRLVLLVAAPVFLSVVFCVGGDEWTGFFLLPCLACGLTASLSIGLLEPEPPRKRRRRSVPPGAQSDDSTVS